MPGLDRDTGRDAARRQRAPPVPSIVGAARQDACGRRAPTSVGGALHRCRPWRAWPPCAAAEGGPSAAGPVSSDDPAMVPLSILDLSPISEGGDAAQSFRNSLALAQHGEKLGLSRATGWPSTTACRASPAPRPRCCWPTSAPAPRRIRIGAGGVMLPNHSPLVIAEQFGTLESLYPGRIDLGLGRAPGSDQRTARALRRNLESDADQFPQDVVELMDFMSQGAAPGGARGAGHGPGGAGLDPRLQHLRRPARRAPGPALRLRLALRAAADDAGDPALPRDLQAVEASWTSPT